MYVQRATQSRRSESWVLVNVNVAYMHPSSVRICLPMTRDDPMSDSNYLSSIFQHVTP